MRHTPLLAAAGLVLVALAIFAAAPASAGTKTKPAPLRSTVQLDLSRYMGRWWVIAHTPYFAEKGKVATADVYTLRPDGKIENTYVYRKRFGGAEKQMHGVATVVPGTGNAQWKIAFFGGLVRADYLVLEVAPDYSWALIGQPSRKLAWVFARDPQMDDAQLASLLAKFPGYGYDPARLQRVPQQPPRDN
jgi:apolipoprotein D and lipocalin family protein